ncbi:alpha/beta hydrolase [Streptomyces albus]|uniref:alpha/beta hydrolase n=1 Tax=Streptomyces albus TaxID=1888 RepID=UPI001AEC12F9|nr:alpha/beta hydrolase [Streptomyces albus]UVN55043.1 alpha/beta hydrolase [Streptomyces albus]
MERAAKDRLAPLPRTPGAHNANSLSDPPAGTDDPTDTGHPPAHTDRSPSTTNGTPAGTTEPATTELTSTTEPTSTTNPTPGADIPAAPPSAQDEDTPPMGDAAPEAGPACGAQAARWRAVARGARRRLAALVRRPYWEAPNSSYVLRRWPGLTALWCATLFFWLSLTPSLVPRPWPLQGVIGGITAAMGYAIGGLAEWLIRLALAPLLRRYGRLLPGRRHLRPSRHPRPSQRWRARAWLAYYALSTLLTIAALSLSADAQRELRRLQGMPAALTWHSLMIALLALGICTFLVALGRAVRLGTRALIRVLGRFVPRPLAIGAGLLVSATVVVFGTRDVVFDRGVIDVAAHLAEKTDKSTKDGITRPRSSLVSGSTASLVHWDDLGYEGRNFTGSSLSADQIASVTGKGARQPVRVYVGQESAPTFRARARLAVRELERTGAFDRDVLAVAGTTGRGWVNSTDAEPLEYIHHGNTAIVAVQYSYLPSWASFLVDKEQAGRATRALVEAVRARWLEIPAAERPKLVVFGESLGAYGIEAAFDGPDDLLAKVDGAVLAGTPNFSPIRRELTAHRDPGSPVWRPEYDEGRHFRFAQWPRKDLARPGPESAWGTPRVVYLQNASDAIVWWSPELALHRPRWLREPLGPDITGAVNWFPLVTFWQTTVDMAVSYGVDAPHGHRYGNGSVEAWAAVAPSEGWTDADTERLRRFMDRREAPY